MKALVTILLASFTLSSCMFSNCVQKDLTNSDKRWFKNFKAGQKIAFKSDQANFDTLVVTKTLDFFTSCNRLERSNFQFKNIGVKFSSHRYEDIIYAKFQATEKNNVQQSFMFVDLYAYYYGNDINKCADKIKIESIADSIAVYTFDTSNAESEGKGLIKSFSWSKDYGIVRYITKDDEKFELLK